MQKLTGYKSKEKFFIALLPIDGKYTMSAEEAVEVSKIIKPDLTIPMHHWENEKTIEVFKDICKAEKISYKII